MKHYLFFLLALTLCLTSCKKDSWLDWKAHNQAWLDHNATLDSIELAPSGSGLQYKVLREGNPGQVRPDRLKTVIISYKGSLITGNVFAKSMHNNPDTLEVSTLISGLAEGLCKMTPPAHYIFYIPANLAYGEGGHGVEGVKGYIPPYSTLIFDVELEQVY